MTSPAASPMRVPIIGFTEPCLAVGGPTRSLRAGTADRLAIADVAVLLVVGHAGRQCAVWRRKGVCRSLFFFHLFLFFVGSVAMRGAGCTYNDLVDHNIDMQVARTRSRPLPSGRVRRKEAKIFILAQALVGLAVLLCFNGFSIVLGILSLAIVAIYPFAKRFTDWPQFFSVSPSPGVG